MTKNIVSELLERKTSLAVVGLGYVGLPIAIAFAKKGILVAGFDTNLEKINELKENRVLDVGSSNEGIGSTRDNITFTHDPAHLKKASLIIVAVPTPIDEHKTPDLNPLKEASRLIGRNLSRGAIVVYESTVYPGVTEEVCVPTLEKSSGLSYKNGEFFVGYSPERINPGDQEHTLQKIVKIVSGQNAAILDLVADVYEIVVEAGVYRAESIKVAEAAKVIENTQRDLNIALMNELAIIFEKIGIDTEQVLRAAGTKWNFLKFHPGLVGGHCIGVDPYYLTSKAEEMGYHPQVVLAGRRINDSMGSHIAQQTIKQMIQAGKVIRDARILVLGVTFKEDVDDVRNSRVLDITRELSSYGTKVYAHDPFVEVLPPFFDAQLLNLSQVRDIDAIVLATPHKRLREITLSQYHTLCRMNNGRPVFIDVRWVFDEDSARKAGFHYWRL